MSRMKTQDPHQELQDGFDLAPPPPIGPDGAPGVPPQRTSPPARPSLCQAGPCRRYHRLVVQVDAEQPGAVRLPIVLPEGTPGAQQTPQGTVYCAPSAFHVQTHHYCYPDTGIEMPLGALPVVECNRWEPRVPPGVILVRGTRGVETRNREQPREAVERLFWDSAAGQAFRADVAAWEAARATEVLEAAEAERLIALSMETPTIACQVCGNRYEEQELDIQMRCGECRGANLQPRAIAVPFHGVLRTCHPGNKCSNYPDCENCGPARI